MSLIAFSVKDYDLGSTLTSGQAFRWERDGANWTGVVGEHWVRLEPTPEGIRAETATEVKDWTWLREYLQLEVQLDLVLKTFPDDAPMRVAVAACRGLRLLRQDPWECLASFILSSTKQIVQIRQIVRQVCECFGTRIAAPETHGPQYSFPAAARLAALAESELRACKMGFRAPYLLGAARMISSGELELEGLRRMSVPDARGKLMEVPGVGRKIADCVLLFAYGFQSAFPVDVWVMKALRELYFRGRRTNLKRLHRFAETHFGPNSGYAQQYLFHYMRIRKKESEWALA